MRVNIHTAVSIGILLLMGAMVIAAIVDMRQDGSLDDLSADEIKARVNGH